MNRTLGMVSAAVNICAVAAFALCMPFGFLFGDYISSILIALSFVPMMCAFAAYGKSETNAAGYAGITLAGMYAAIILLVYFAQITTVRLDRLNVQATVLLDYQTFGLFFNYDLLGYGLMALSTYFIGLTIKPNTKAEKGLKWLLLVHGIFAFGCFVMPVLGIFHTDAQGSSWVGTAILEFWCAYFIPVGVLSFLYFQRRQLLRK